MTMQNYSNHRRYVLMYHVVLLIMLLATLGGAIVHLVKSIGDGKQLYGASLILALTLCVILITFMARIFSLKAQDRAIRAEENLRHFVLTGTLLDSRLTTRQIIGLRFAADEEFPPLAERARLEQLTEDQIKKNIKTWKPDTYRV
jgi:hypothetical protein